LTAVLDASGQQPAPVRDPCLDLPLDALAVEHEMVERLDLREFDGS
jgi:hypothetical protein